MNPRPAQLRRALLDDRRVCFGPVCQGREAYPPYYFTSGGHCVECEAAVGHKGKGTEADEAGVASTNDLGDYLGRLSNAGLTLADVGTLSRFYVLRETGAEIAAALNLTVRAVELRLQRARAKLAHAGLPLPTRPDAPTVENWSAETMQLLEQSVSGRWRLRRSRARYDRSGEEN